MRERPIVTVEWLESHLTDGKVKVVDASWHLPPENRDAHAEYLDAHIPGAVFFDIDKISTPSDLPHMLPEADSFADSVGKLGLEKDNIVVVYDSKGLFSAARVWWTLKVFGYSDVRILDGGLPAWKTAGFALKSGEVEAEPVSVEAVLSGGEVVSAAEVLDASNKNHTQIIDARSVGRFNGVDPEPRAGLRGGHIPGSVCVPFTELLTDGKLKPTADLQQVFDAAGITQEKPVITSCGSGVTAAILTLGLYCTGRDDTLLYNGSWTEWGGRGDLPVV